MFCRIQGYLSTCCPNGASSTDALKLVFKGGCLGLRGIEFFWLVVTISEYKEICPYNNS